MPKYRIPVARHFRQDGYVEVEASDKFSALRMYYAVDEHPIVWNETMEDEGEIHSLSYSECDIVEEVKDENNP
jgi:hypothetical protein